MPFCANKHWMKKVYRPCYVRLNQLSTIRPSQKPLMTPMIWNPSRPTTCYFSTQSLLYPLGYFIQKTATPDADCGRYNIWLTFFGRGGQKNICPSYRNVKNGCSRGETLSQEILFSSLMILPHATPGSWAGSYKPYRTPED